MICSRSHLAAVVAAHFGDVSERQLSAKLRLRALHKLGVERKRHARPKQKRTNSAAVAAQTDSELREARIAAAMSQFGTSAHFGSPRKLREQLLQLAVRALLHGLDPLPEFVQLLLPCLLPVPHLRSAIGQVRLSATDARGRPLGQHLRELVEKTDNRPDSATNSSRRTPDSRKSRG